MTNHMQTRRILLGASVFAAAVIATSIIGPYETGERMSFVSRVGYWSSLIFCAGAVFFAIRYGARWAMDRIGFDDYRTEAITAAIAAIGFALPLPFVATQLNAYLTGQESALPFWPIYGSATALSLLIWCVMLVRRVTERWDIVPALPEQAAAKHAPQLVPVLMRAGFNSFDRIACVESEDHYLRLHGVDGKSTLVLYRFADAIAELDATGLQVHRSFWVASHAVTGAELRGKRLSLVLSNGQHVPVSDTYAASVKAKGWSKRTV